MTSTDVRQQQLALYSQIPEGIRCGLIHRIVYGFPPGDFLEAVFNNDLMEAFGRADLDSARGMRALVTWLYSFAPRSCRGGLAEQKAWTEHRLEWLPECCGLKTGLEIFAELGDELAVQALGAIQAGTVV